MIKHSLEAHVTVHFTFEAEHQAILNAFSDELDKSGQDLASFLKEFVIVSEFVLAQTEEGLTESTMPGIYAAVKRATGDKCPRCWHWQETSHANKLCGRCQRVLNK